MVARWGDEVAPGGRTSTAPPSPGTRSPRRRTANGSRACCGRGSASASGRGARSRRARAAAARARGRGAAAVRGRDGRGVRRYLGSGRRRGDPARARRRREGTRRSTSARRGSSPRRRKRPRATYAVANSGTLDELEQTLSAVLEKLEQRHEHAIRHDPSPRRAARRAAPRARCCAGRRGCSAPWSSPRSAVAAVVAPGVDKAVKEIALPLRHEDIIRQQAADKGLDPALIAGVIYTESRFRDQTSHAGAKGLMQLLPSTADDIARKSGGTAFVRATSPTRRSTSPTARSTCAICSSRYGGNVVLARRRLQRGRGQGRRVDLRGPPTRRGLRPRAPHPVPRDAALRPAGA